MRCERVAQASAGDLRPSEGGPGLYGPCEGVQIGVHEAILVQTGMHCLRPVPPFIGQHAVQNRAKTPLICFVSRLVDQKGVDLLILALGRILRAGAQAVVLGSGESRYETALMQIGEEQRERCRVWIGFDNPLAHRIYAGSDMLLMPSIYEPCGLNQIYSLRYGTVPVVRKTGGLADTIREYDPATGEGTGFVFSDYDPKQFKAAIHRALALWPQRTKWQRLMRNGMRVELGWKESARKYVEAYELLRKM